MRLASNRPDTGTFGHIDTLGLAQLLLARAQADTFLPAARELLGPLDKVVTHFVLILGPASA